MMVVLNELRKFREQWMRDMIRSKQDRRDITKFLGITLEFPKKTAQKAKSRSKGKYRKQRLMNKHCAYSPQWAVLTNVGDEERTITEQESAVNNLQTQYGNVRPEKGESSDTPLPYDGDMRSLFIVLNMISTLNPNECPPTELEYNSDLRSRYRPSHYRRIRA